MSKIISPDSAHGADGLAPHSDDVASITAIASGTSIFFTLHLTATHVLHAGCLRLLVGGSLPRRQVSLVVETQRTVMAYSQYRSIELCFGLFVRLGTRCNLSTHRS
jgi:hypothetical protein